MVKEGEKGSFRAKFNTPCKACGTNISPGDTAHFIKGENGYWCGECEEKRAASQPKPQDAGEAISKAHAENMESAKLTRDVLANLTVAIITLRDAIERKVKDGKA